MSVSIRNSLAEDPILRYLPSEFLNDPFWSESHVQRPSTFGVSAKSTRVKVDSPDKLFTQVKTWVQQDEFGGSYGRLPVREMWGKYGEPPPPGQYNPDHEKLSKREIGPKHAFPSKPKDHYFEEVQFAKNNPFQHFPNPHEDVFKPKKNLAPKKSIKVTDLQRINLDEMRKSLLPGPGTYNVNMEYAVRFDRTPTPILNCRKPIVNARQTLDYSNADIIDDRNKKNDKTYDINTSQVSKRYPSYTLGASRPLLYQREYPRAGPGDYNDDRVFRIGHPVPISSASKPKR